VAAMKARYSLSTHIASFDFYSWLVLVKAAGATEIVFDTARPKTTKWPADIVLRRYESIIAPGPALAGLPSRKGTDGEPVVNPHMRFLVEHSRAGRRFERLRTVLPAGAARYTVTLRNDRRIPERNSNVPAWRTFAAEIGALVIDDYDDAPLGLHERVALYAGAEMNFGVPNGPMHLCALTPYPFMVFDCDHCAGGFLNAGIRFGEPCPWGGPNQRWIWEPDELPVLRRVFREWQDAR
jgi:hypothetical protein